MSQSPRPGPRHRPAANSGAQAEQAAEPAPDPTPPARPRGGHDPDETARPVKSGKDKPAPRPTPPSPAVVTTPTRRRAPWNPASVLPVPPREYEAAGSSQSAAPGPVEWRGPNGEKDQDPKTPGYQGPPAPRAREYEAAGSSQSAAPSPVEWRGPNGEKDQDLETPGYQGPPRGRPAPEMPHIAPKDCGTPVLCHELNNPDPGTHVEPAPPPGPDEVPIEATSRAKCSDPASRADCHENSPPVLAAAGAAKEDMPASSHPGAQAAMRGDWSKLSDSVRRELGGTPRPLPASVAVVAVWKSQCADCDLVLPTPPKSGGHDPDQEDWMRVQPEISLENARDASQEVRYAWLGAIHSPAFSADEESHPGVSKNRVQAGLELWRQQLGTGLPYALNRLTKDDKLRLGLDPNKPVTRGLSHEELEKLFRRSGPADARTGLTPGQEEDAVEGRAHGPAEVLAPRPANAVEQRLLAQLNALERLDPVERRAGYRGPRSVKRNLGDLRTAITGDPTKPIDPSTPQSEIASALYGGDVWDPKPRLAPKAPADAVAAVAPSPKFVERLTPATTLNGGIAPGTTLEQLARQRLGAGATPQQMQAEMLRIARLNAKRWRPGQEIDPDAAIPMPRTPLVVAPGTTLREVARRQLGPRATTKQVLDEVRRIAEANAGRYGGAKTLDPDAPIPTAAGKLIIPPSEAALDAHEQVLLDQDALRNVEALRDRHKLLNGSREQVGGYLQALDPSPPPEADGKPPKDVSVAEVLSHTGSSDGLSLQGTSIDTPEELGRAFNEFWTAPPSDNVAENVITDAVRLPFLALLTVKDVGVELYQRGEEAFDESKRQREPTWDRPGEKDVEYWDRTHRHPITAGIQVGPDDFVRRAQGGRDRQGKTQAQAFHDHPLLEPFKSLGPFALVLPGPKAIRGGATALGRVARGGSLSARVARPRIPGPMLVLRKRPSIELTDAPTVGGPRPGISPGARPEPATVAPKPDLEGPSGGGAPAESPLKVEPGPRGGGAPAPRRAPAGGTRPGGPRSTGGRSGGGSPAAAPAPRRPAGGPGRPGGHSSPKPNQNGPGRAGGSPTALLEREGEASPNGGVVTLIDGKRVELPARPAPELRPEPLDAAPNLPGRPFDPVRDVPTELPPDTVPSEIPQLSELAPTTRGRAQGGDGATARTGTPPGERGAPSTEPPTPRSGAGQRVRGGDGAVLPHEGPQPMVPSDTIGAHVPPLRELRRPGQARTAPGRGRPTRTDERPTTTSEPSTPTELPTQTSERPTTTGEPSTPSELPTTTRERPATRTETQTGRAGGDAFTPAPTIGDPLPAKPPTGLPPAPWQLPVVAPGYRAVDPGDPNGDGYREVSPGRWVFCRGGVCDPEAQAVNEFGMPAGAKRDPMDEAIPGQSALERDWEDFLNAVAEIVMLKTKLWNIKQQERYDLTYGWSDLSQKEREVRWGPEATDLNAYEWVLQRDKDGALRMEDPANEAFRQQRWEQVRPKASPGAEAQAQKLGRDALAMEERARLASRGLDAFVEDLGHALLDELAPSLPKPTESLAGPKKMQRPQRPLWDGDAAQLQELFDQMIDRMVADKVLSSEELLILKDWAGVLDVLAFRYGMEERLANAETWAEVNVLEDVLRPLKAKSGRGTPSEQLRDGLELGDLERQRKEWLEWLEYLQPEKVMARVQEYLARHADDLSPEAAARAGRLRMADIILGDVLATVVRKPEGARPAATSFRGRGPDALRAAVDAANAQGLRTTSVKVENGEFVLEARAPDPAWDLWDLTEELGLTRLDLPLDGTPPLSSVLTREQALVLVMHRALGMSLGRVAEVMGRDLGTVAKAKYQALAVLRDRYAELAAELDKQRVEGLMANAPSGQAARMRKSLWPSFRAKDDAPAGLRGPTAAERIGRGERANVDAQVDVGGIRAARRGARTQPAIELANELEQLAARLHGGGTVRIRGHRFHGMSAEGAARLARDRGFEVDEASSWATPSVLGPFELLLRRRQCASNA